MCCRNFVVCKARLFLLKVSNVIGHVFLLLLRLTLIKFAALKTIGYIFLLMFNWRQ